MKTARILFSLQPAKTSLKKYSMKPEENKNFKEKITKEWTNAPQKLSTLFTWMQSDLQKYLKRRKITEKYINQISSIWKFHTLQPLASKYMNKIKLQSSDVNNFSSRNSRNTDSKRDIHSQTKNVISLLRSKNPTASLQERLEDLSSHLRKYPEAKFTAVKEGAIPLLLWLRRTEQNNEEIQAELRESLALLGHVDPLPNKGIRILSIDGGGTRGVIAVEMLKKLEELTGKHIYQLFDLICGVSTGAILACLLGVHKKSSQECSAIYKELSAKIFSQSPIWGTRNLVMSHSYYDSKLFESLLKEVIGSTPLIKTARDPFCPKLAIVSTVVNKPQILAHIFRNYELPYEVSSRYVGSSHHELWKAVRASSAAPLYFEDFHIGELVHQDGGVLINNPAAVAIHEAQNLWPNSSLQCVLSLGTGRMKDNGIHLSNISQMNELDPDISLDEQPLKERKAENKSSSLTNTASTSWKTIMLRILDSATDTERVNTILHDLLPEGIYYRFNPHVTGDMPIDNAQPEFIQQLKMDSETYIQKNEVMFQEVAAALMTPKSTAQKCSDWLKMKHLEGLQSLFSIPRQQSQKETDSSAE